METLSNKTSSTQHKEEEKANPNELLMSWIRCVRFKESEKTAMNVKLLKHDNFLNPRLLIKTNDLPKKMIRSQSMSK